MSENMSENTTTIHSAALRAELDKHSLPGPPQEGDYAELASEEDPNGIVVIKRKDGTPIMQMARREWDDILQWQKEEG